MNNKNGDIMKNLKIFIIGAFGYMIAEILWRSYTHWTMGILGGLCFMLIYNSNKVLKNVILWKRCVCFAIIITFLELVSGIIINIWLKLGVWDYSAIPLNIYGQICPLYSLIWFISGFPISKLCNKLD